MLVLSLLDGVQAAYLGRGEDWEPYENIIKFSDDPDDLSNAQCTDDFLDRFELAARWGYELLAPGRFGVLIIGDKYTRGSWFPWSGFVWSG